MNIQEIVEQWLRDNGYDGLFSPTYCACAIGDDFMPCGEPGNDCEAGYKTACPGPEDCEADGDCDFHIGSRKAKKMRPYRGIPIGKTEFVHGSHYYNPFSGIHQILRPKDETTFDRFEVVPETVGQSTGKRDSKRTKEYPEGQEIYQGDEVQIVWPTKTKDTYIVEWVVRGEGHLGGWQYSDPKDNRYYAGSVSHHVKVIGNIHQNPKLREQAGKDEQV